MDARSGTRPFTSALPSSVLDQVQHGVLRSSYRGVPCLKSPFDLALYMQLLGRLRPSTVIEIGTKFGGSALWFADMLTTHGIAEGHVVTVDVEPRVGYSDQRIEVVVGDAAMLADALPAARLRTYSKPWLVVEDSSHLFADALAVLEFFDAHLASGDYIVVEDGVLSQFTDPSYARFEDGPNRAVRTFIEQNGDKYEIDTALCDHYGYNVTYNPNGWLRRK